MNHIVDRIAKETESVIDDIMPWPHHPGRMQQMASSVPWPDELAVPSPESGYIRFIDVQRLAGLARKYHVRIRILRRVGHFIPAGIPVMMVSKGSRLSPEETARLLSAVDTGPTRTLQQDVEFGVLQIVDIALKAISPAVNDPSTAINCIDQLSRIMIRFASRQPPDECFFDPPGVVRVSVGWIHFARLLDAALEQIRMYSKSDLAVSLRLLRAMIDIAVSTPDPDFRRILVERGLRTVAGCAEKLGDDEMRELRARQALLETFTAVPRTEGPVMPAPNLVP